MNIFLVNKLTRINDDDSDSPHDIDFIGVFSSEDLANEAISLFESSELVSFFIESYELDKVQPPVSEVFEKISTLEELIKHDLVDYTVDTDGSFVYELTEKGRNIAEAEDDLL
jgi:hypothetical protein